jgi:hypothetical protein
MILSPIATVVELIEVVVPFTNKSPLIVTLLPVTSIAPLIELEKVLSSSILFERDDDITPIDDVIELDTLLIELDNELDNVVILLNHEVEAASINIEVIDVTGKIVLSKKENSKTTKINLSTDDLINGLYFIKIKSGKFISTQKLLINK